MKLRELEQRTALLLDEQAWPVELREAAVGLYEGLRDLGGIDDRDPLGEDAVETLLPAGKALSPVEAGRCVPDYARTMRFLRGIAAAVAERRAARPERPVELLYAGCGPFAALALPLTTRFGPDALRLTLVDVHERSLRSLRRIVGALGREAWIRGCVRADASRLRIAPGARFDLLVVEAMQRGLQAEPQVAIAWNLLPQLPADAVLLPEAVTLRLCIADLGAEVASALAPDSRRSERTELGRVFELSAAAIRSWGPYRPQDPAGFDPVRIVLPRALRPGEHLALLTRVRIHGPHVLDDRDSGLSSPSVVGGQLRLEAGEELLVGYRLSPPGLVYSQP